MQKKIDIRDLSQVDLATLAVAGDIFKNIGRVLVSTEHGVGAFLFMIAKGDGQYLSAYGETLDEAANGAIAKYRDWEPSDELIKSAVKAVDVIRERVAAGEDVNAVLADIKVA